MKTKKASIWILMTALMVSLLAGCSGGSKEPDENSGLYKAVSVKAFGMEMSADEVYDDGITIELQDGGKAVFSYEGDDYKMKWSRDRKHFEAKGGGAELSGTIGDGVLVLEDILGTGMEIRLECKSLMRKSSRADKEKTKEKDKDPENDTDSASELLGIYYATGVLAVGEIQEADDRWELELKKHGRATLVMEDEYDLEWYVEDDVIYLSDGEETTTGRFTGDLTLSLRFDGEFIQFVKDGSPDSGNSSAAGGGSKTNQFGYDMEEAKKYVGDWIGYVDLGFATEGRKLHYGIPLGTGGAGVYARIVIDENGEPVVYMRAEVSDWLNFREVSATLDENATMRINGYFADNGWAYVLSPPDENDRKIEIGGPFMTADGGELFHVYLKPIGSQWDRSELPYIKDIHFTSVNDNTKIFGDKGYTLDEVLEEMQESYDSRQNLELQGDEQIRLITDELPAASMLDLY